MITVIEFIIRYSGILTIVLSISVIVALIVFILLKIREKLMERIVYHRTFSDIGAYEGEYVTLIETAYNPTPFPMFFVNIEGYIYNGIPMDEYQVDPKKAMQYYVSRFHLWPYMQIKRRHKIKCAKRGYYRLETVDIVYNRKARYIEAPADLYVYPKIIPLNEESQPASDKQGDAFSRRRLISDPFSVSGIREYRPGDSFNMINFKATARSGSINMDAFRVNNRDFCSARTFMVYLNFQTDADTVISTKSYEAMMELGLSFSSAIIREAAYSGYRAGFAANCMTSSGADNIRFAIEGGDSHLEEILKEMAKVRHKTGISFYSMLDHDIKGGICDSEIYIITPFASEILDEQISFFRRFGNNVNVLRLEDEEREREKLREREQQRIEEEKRAEEEEMLRKSEDRVKLQAVLDEKKRMEAENEKRRRAAEEAKRKAEYEARVAESRGKTAHILERQEANKKLLEEINSSEDKEKENSDVKSPKRK